MKQNKKKKEQKAAEAKKLKNEGAFCTKFFFAVKEVKRAER